MNHVKNSEFKVMLVPHKIGMVLSQRYLINAVLGKGGCGTTYRAQTLDTKEILAIKAISLREMKDAKQLELLEREVEVLKKLDHPGIPHYLDYFEIDSDTDKIFYIVQQLAPGKTLAQWVEEGWRSTEAEVKGIAEQALNILDYLHSFDPPIIHRDIKPHNLIRSPEGNLFLVDFGAVQTAYYSTFMGGKTTVGTFGYMPIEQAGGRAIAASDLYALGATLAYVLTHRSPGELSTDGLALDFRSRSNLSEEFADWLEKILEPEVEERFPSAKAALTALKNPRLVREGKLNPIRRLVWLGLGVASIAGFLLFDNYKWTILTGLGFSIPREVCQKETATLEYLSTGGNLPQTRSRECLLQAISLNNKDIVKSLIARGADINVKDQYGYTPLLESAYYGQKEILELLIAKGGDFNLDVNVQNDNGDSPLFGAVERGHTDIAEWLIARGADVNLKNNQGFTPLYSAIKQSHKAIVELLITNGAKVNLQNNNGNTPLHWAAGGGMQDIVKLLITNSGEIDINVKNENGDSPLYAAAERGYKDIIELLIAKEADVNIKNNNGFTPLHSATKQGHKDVVELLIAKGAKINIKNNNGNTPLTWAAYYGQKDIVELLIAKGADVNTRNKFGGTTIGGAIDQGHRDIVEILQKHGAK